MEYNVLVDTYEALTKTRKRLEKTAIVAALLDKTKDQDVEQTTLLLSGRIFPAWSEKKIGVATRYVIKALSVSSGETPEKIESLWKQKGDLGLVAASVMKTKKQATLFSTSLTVKKVFTNMQKLADETGSGSVDRKVQLIAELLSNAKPLEAQYVIRTALEQMRVGVGSGIVRDAIGWSVFPQFVQLFKDGYKEKEDHDKYKELKETKDLDKCKEKEIVFETELKAREVYKELTTALDHAFHMTNDFAVVLHVARQRGYEGLIEMDIEPFRPVQVMLYKKAADVKEAFKMVGTPAAFEYKYDGFRIECHKVKDKISLYTRNFEDVTKQFPDVVDAIKRHVKCDSCIFDSEVVGYNKTTTQYVAFQKISQRIRRKHGIAAMAKELPVEINVFDLLYLDGKSVIDKPFHERRALLGKMIEPVDRIIVLSRIMITDKEEEAMKFYNEALDKGNEGIMVKNLEAIYKPGSRVGFGVKVKPVMESLDLAIVGAEWGTGKRANWMTSFIVACRNDQDELLTIGKVGTGIKELEGEGVTFGQLTEMLKKDITNEKGKEITVTPKIIIEVHYEEIQKSPTYTSGYALRFPRFIRLREDRGVHDCSLLDQVEELYDEQRGRKS